VEKIKISLYTLLKSLSNAQDLISPILSNHHQQVAYMSFHLAQEQGFTLQEQKDIFLAGLVHDIGAISKKERLDVIEKEAFHVNHHAFIGAKLMGDFKPLANSAKLIKYHHLPWEHGKGTMYQGEEVAFGSHTLHLADRVCAAIKKDQNVISQIPKIMGEIVAKEGSIFSPGAVQALKSIYKKESLWLDMVSDDPVNKINFSIFDIVELEMEDIIELAHIFSQIIDFRSSFTARHSAGVAVIAEKLAFMVGFSPIECQMILVAGYLHDLGKLSISNSVLEKPSKLNEDEFNEIRAHSYYTYQLLEPIPQFRLINEWASYHHERLDGKGYPFHIEGQNLSLGSRIMAVADVFTAITENRPYREGMTQECAIMTLENMVAGNMIDERVVTLLIDNYDMIDALREIAQKEAEEKYAQFLTLYI